MTRADEHRLTEWLSTEVCPVDMAEDRQREALLCAMPGGPLCVVIALIVKLAYDQFVQWQRANLVRAAPTEIRSASGAARIGPSAVTGTSWAAMPDSPCNRTGPFGVVITWLGKEWTG